MNTDNDWEDWGKNDPYFGVLTLNKFRSENLTDDALKDFFESGQDHINHILQVVRSYLDPNFSPKRALDFGCGVGRIVIPLSKTVEFVTGLDVSESMLREAHKNCEKYSARNVSLLKSDDALFSLEGLFDFIHSFIVFQHIPVDRGSRIFRNLLSHLAEGGICAIQLTYAKVRYKKSYGVVPWSIRVKQFIRRMLPKKDPWMEMNSCNINEFLFLMQLSGIRNFYVEYSDHEGELGVFLYFQKPKKPS